MLKYCIKVLLRLFPKTLNQFLDLPRGNKHFEICIPVLVVNQNILNQSSFEAHFLGNVLINVEKYSIWAYVLNDCN